MHIDKYERYYLIGATVVMTVFFAALVAASVIYAVQLPDPEGIVNPQRLQDEEFAQDRLGLTLTGETTSTGRDVYEFRYLAQRWNFITGLEDTWEFTIGEGDTETTRTVPLLRIPEGAQVRFVGASLDIQHGFSIEKHNLNYMLIPGQISQAATVFDRVGEYGVLCHEYCGSGHQGMWMMLEVYPADESVALSGNEE